MYETSMLSSSKLPLECNQDQMLLINEGWLDLLNQKYQILQENYAVFRVV